MNVKCQIFTPENYVEELLDSINYKRKLYGKKILENSCGDGNIIVEIVSRYIRDCKKEGLNSYEISKGLSQDIYGYEIDTKYYDICIKKLNKILLDENINLITWKIYNADYLKENIQIKFDYIVANPPYITYRDLSIQTRKILKETYKSCTQGKFDYCYAFIEKGYNSLSLEGKMTYLIPSSIFKTVFGNNLRNILKGNLVKIIDYATIKIFDEALVASSIFVIDRKNYSQIFKYLDYASHTEIEISKTELRNKWVFTNRYKNIGVNRFGDYFKVSHAVATLFNNAFVIKEWEENDNEVIVTNNFEIEEEVLRPTASPRTKKHGKNELIIFPYYYTKEEGRLQKYTEDEFTKKFPKACKYLNQFMNELDNRDSDANAHWFEYGRSQGLSHMNQDKLLISTIVTDNVNVYFLEKDSIPYSGMFIIPKSNLYDLEYAVTILQSNKFLEYIKKIGIQINGSSIRITSKDIEDYKF